MRGRNWGGRRDGAGRKPGGRGASPHRARSDHDPRRPVRLVLRVVRGLPSLRRQRMARELQSAFRQASRPSFRVLHFSVRPDSLHLVVEAHDKGSIARGVAGLAIRAARRNNRLLGRCGRFWEDRYRSRELVSAKEVRDGILEVLTIRSARAPWARVDPCGSGFWFDGWKIPPSSGPPGPDERRSPVRRPRTWLARRAWRYLGLLSPGRPAA